MNKIITEKQENYNDFIRRKKTTYVCTSLKSSSEIEFYTKKLNIYNTKSGEVHPIKYDFMQNQKNNYLWYNFVSTYIQNKAVASGLKAVFVTLTNDSDLHRYKTLKNGTHIINKKFTNSRDGYKPLNDSFRALYNSFRIKNKLIKLSFLRVVEPHKDFTPHLHGIVFLKESQIKPFEHHFLNTIKRFKLGKQYDFTVLKDTSSSVSYILKYVKKSLYTDKEGELRVIDGWKKENKIRMFTHSQISVTREIYKVVSRFVDLKSDCKSYSILENLENRIDLNVKYVCDGQVYKEKDLFNSEARYSVNVIKKKTEHKDLDLYMTISDRYRHWTHFVDIFKDLDDLSFNWHELHDYYYQHLELETELYYVDDRYNYKNFFQLMKFEDFIDLLQNFIHHCLFYMKPSYSIKDFTIYDKVDKVYLYEKKDFELL